MVMLDAVTAAAFTAARQQLQQDIHARWHHDAYIAWVRQRPATTWDTGAAAEAWHQVGTGAGKLSENGASGPVAGEDVIAQQAPYRFRTLATAAFVPGVTWLVTSGRLFRVEAFTVEDLDDQLATAFLSELFDTPLPVEGAP